MIQLYFVEIALHQLVTVNYYENHLPAGEMYQMEKELNSVYLPADEMYQMEQELNSV